MIVKAAFLQRPWDQVVKLEEDSLMGLVGMAVFMLLYAVLTKTVSLKHDQAMKRKTNWKGN